MAFRHAGAWIESAIRNGVTQIESQRAGRLAVLAKLAETLFVESLCRYMDELPPPARYRRERKAQTAAASPEE